MIKKRLSNKTKVFKTIPKFKNESDERDFWAKADTSLYFDLSKGRHARFPNLKLTTEKQWNELKKYGRKKAKELGITSEEDVYRIMGDA